MTSTLSPPQPHASHRWTFLRDVWSFSLNCWSIICAIRTHADPLAAALVDLVFKGEREGALFYKVLRWGAHSEKIIDVYSAIEHHETGASENNPNYTIDGVIARLEGVLVREYEKGGTAASIKSAMDRAIDQLHRETSGTRVRAREVVERAADRLRTTFDSESREKEE